MLATVHFGEREFRFPFEGREPRPAEMIESALSELRLSGIRFPRGAQLEPRGPIDALDFDLIPR